MSMTVLTIFQIAEILAAYLFVTFLLPCIFLHRRLKVFELPARFMAYFMAGNFYIVNLTLALQLLHIGNRFMLIIGTVLPFIAAAAVKYRGSYLAMIELWSDQVRLVLEKELGVRTFLMRLTRKIRRFFSTLIKERLRFRWLDILLTGGIIVLVFYMYGTNALRAYGYCASDVIVHNYWINETAGNRIFADGIYPFGFHCVIYYLHELFVIPTFVLLRIFFLIQTLMVHLMLLAFLKVVCKSKYAPYAGVFIYLVSNIFSKASYIRYYASIPQEFGILFILPAIYFAIAFLEGKEPSPVGKGSGFLKRIGKEKGGLSLILFSVGISMTLSCHFYDTIVAALFCAGIAVGFCFRCFRWKYLKRIVAAGVLGLFLALFPMGVAYATGIPLQGSLYWGMSVMTSNDAADEGDALQTEESDDGRDTHNTADRLRGKWICILDNLQCYVAANNAAVARFFVQSTGALFLLGFLWIVFGRKEYGGILLSTGVFMALLFIVQASKDLGIPQLLDEFRCPVYIGYGLAVVWSLCVDAALFLVFQKKRAIHAGSVAVVAAVCVTVTLTGIRELPKVEAMETNEAVICLTNIIHENGNDKTWTICSANDELQMARDYGYHYETIEFLRKIERATDSSVVTIPTDCVYFFIEKEPLIQSGSIGLQKSGRIISEEGAKQPLPEGGGISVYSEEARWIVMSRMYYWAKEFQKLYPNEMEVYYETDGFICYRVQQNEYSLYNFAIDYGYN